MADFNKVIQGMKEAEQKEEQAKPNKKAYSPEVLEKADKMAKDGVQFGDRRWLTKSNDGKYKAYGNNEPDKEIDPEKLAALHDAEETAKKAQPKPFEEKPDQLNIASNEKKRIAKNEAATRQNEKQFEKQELPSGQYNPSKEFGKKPTAPQPKEEPKKTVGEDLEDMYSESFYKSSNGDKDEFIDRNIERFGIPKGFSRKEMVDFYSKKFDELDAKYEGAKPQIESVDSLWNDYYKYITADQTPENIEKGNELAERIAAIVYPQATPEQKQRYDEVSATFKDPQELKGLIDEIMGKKPQSEEMKSYPKEGTPEGAFEFRLKKPIKKSSYGDNIYETEDGEEWFIGNEEQAYEAAKQDILELFDDMGLESFSESFQDWILEYAIRSDFLDQVREEEAQYREEDGDTDTAEWLRDMNDRDFVATLRYDLFGDENEFKKWLKKHDAINLDRVAEEAISWDGVPHFIATYDGNEVELPNGLYAYRLN